MCRPWPVIPIDSVSLYSFSDFLSPLILGLKPSFCYVFKGFSRKWLAPRTRAFTYQANGNDKNTGRKWYQTKNSFSLYFSHGFLDKYDTNNPHFSLTFRWWPLGSSIPNAFWFHVAEMAPAPGWGQHHFHVRASAIIVIEDHVVGHRREMENCYLWGKLREGFPP